MVKLLAGAIAVTDVQCTPTLSNRNYWLPRSPSDIPTEPSSVDTLNLDFDELYNETVEIKPEVKQK